jgi:hypothetical protein
MSWPPSLPGLTRQSIIINAGFPDRCPGPPVAFPSGAMARAGFGCLPSHDIVQAACANARCARDKFVLQYRRLESEGSRRPTMKTMRAAFALLALCPLTLIDAGPSRAETYRPWCVQYMGRGGQNCGFTSYEQCRMTATPGSGGVCVQNPWYLWYGEHGERGRRR